MTRLCPEGEAVETWGDWETLGDRLGDTSGRSPRGFVWRSASHRITGVCNRWRIHTNWWQQGLPVSALSPLKAGVWREYLKLTTDSGLLCLLFRNLETGRGILAGGQGILAGGRGILAGGQEILAGGRGILAGGQEILAEGRENSTGEGDIWYLARVYD